MVNKKTLVFVLWSVLGLVSPVLCRAQIPSELPCAAGSSDLLSPTYDGNTQATRSWVCVDALGFVTSPVFAASGTPFSTITGGTNTTAAMLVGTGASLAPTGTGTISANRLNGLAVPINAAVVGTNASGQLIAATAVTSFNARFGVVVPVLADYQSLLWTGGNTLTANFNVLDLSANSIVGGASSFTLTAGVGGGGILQLANNSLFQSGGTITLKANAVSAVLTGDGVSNITLGAGGGQTLTLASGVLATTQSAGDNSTKLATTAYADTALALKANLASPTFTGTVTMPITKWPNTASWIPTSGSALTFVTPAATSLLLGSSSGTNVLTLGTSTAAGASLLDGNNNGISISGGNTTTISANGSTGVMTSTGTVFNSPVSATKHQTATNCAVNSVSPAACGSAAAGAVVIPTTTTTYTINTTAVTSASRIMITFLSFASNLPSSPTCVAPSVVTEPTISAISNGVSFTIALSSTTGQTCPMFSIMN